MKAIAIASLCVLAVLPAVLGHATLIYPAPFGTPNSPSKTSPTGGGTVGTPVYPFTGNQFLTWKLIAGDGNGPVRMVINKNPSGTAFTSATTTPTDSNLVVVTLTPILTNTDPAGGALATYGTGDASLGPQTPNNNPFGFTFNVPSGITCTGTMGGYTNSVCTVQISSSSSWYSGFAFSTKAPAAAGGSTGTNTVLQQGTCQAPDPAALQTCSAVVTGIRTISGVSSNKIWVPQGETQSTLDASVQAEYAFNIVKPTVFSINTATHTEDPNAVDPCTTSYKRFLCAQAFVPCNSGNTQPASGAAAQPCGPNCDEFTCWCQLNPIHAILYTCSSYSQAGYDSTGKCASTGHGFGPNNATCVPSANPPGGLDDGGAAPHTASVHSPAALVAIVFFTLVAIYFQ